MSRSFTDAFAFGQEMKLALDRLGVNIFNFYLNQKYLIAVKNPVKTAPNKAESATLLTKSWFTFSYQYHLS